MKKFPLWLICLLVLSIICSIGIILFDIGVIPPIFGNAENAEALNRLMLNISYSYLASTIFALITVLLPTLVSSRSALVKSQRFLIAIYNELAWCYGALSFIDRINTDQSTTDFFGLKYVEINLTNPQTTDVLENIKVTERRYYAKVEYHWTSCTETRTEYIDAITDIYCALNIVTECISNLESSSCFYQLSAKKIDLIDRIRTETQTLKQRASMLKQSVSGNLIIAQNLSYGNYSCLGELTDQLSEIILETKKICRKTFLKLTVAETNLYGDYISTEKVHGDLYRKLDLGGRIYDGNQRI